MQADKPKALAVVGPTASGKSGLAVDLALRFDGEVVSADSRQVYTDLDIGTDKVTAEEKKGVPHHLLDVCDPQTVYSVADYKRDAEKALADIIALERLPIVAGGTGFYIQSIVHGILPAPVPVNEPLRARLEVMSTEELFAMLAQKDPQRAAQIDRYNPVRLVRALEIVDALGVVPPVTTQDSPYEWLQIGLMVPDEALRERIEKRIDDNFAEGLIVEVKNLLRHGLTHERLHSLGLEYRYVSKYLQGEITHEQMLIEMKNKVWQYSRRQKRWFKRDKTIKWFTLDDQGKIFATVENFLKTVDNRTK